MKFFLSLSLVISFVIGINHFYPKHFAYIDDKLLDIFFKSTHSINLQSEQDNIVIIDIDEKSINKVGQWPWSRNTLAEIIKKLNTFNPSVIGFGIVFSEADRTSPSNIAKIDNIPSLENYDETFALAIEKSNVPIVLGYNFLNSKSKKESHVTPYIPAVIKNKVESANIGFFQANDILLNIPIIQDSGYSSGFLNSIKNDNGRIISMPMVMYYKDQLFPSLALEIVRTIYSAREINIKNYNDNNFIEFSNQRIHVDGSVSRFVNYLNTKKGFNHISAIDLLSNNFKDFSAQDIYGKIVLIGSTAIGLSNATPTPFDEDISSIDLQATVIENILNNKTLIQPSWENIFQYVATLIISIIILSSIFFSAAVANVITFLIAISITYISLKYAFANGYILSSAYLFEAMLLSLGASIVIHFMKNKSDIINIKGKFASKVSKAVMDDILDSQKSNKDLSSKKKEVTILFSDIKGFTKITEKINDPDKLTIYINRYMDLMTKNIMHSDGTVDKFMGDAIMAYWNAPNNVSQHADKALTSAIEQISLLSKINEMNLQEQLPLIQIRIGINTGFAFVGEVGGEYRSDYTVMGKAVNNSAILEQACKFYAADIIISESVKAKLEKDYTMLLLDIIQVDGTNDAFNIYQVIKAGLPNQDTLDEIKKFEKAVYLFREADFEGALLILKSLLLRDKLINKRVCDIYIDRCEIHKLAFYTGDFTPIQSINKSLISGSS